VRVMAMRHTSAHRSAEILVPRRRADVVIVMPAASKDAMNKRRGDSQNGDQSRTHLW
jgi:hypothetical protein